MSCCKSPALECCFTPCPRLIFLRLLRTLAAMDCGVARDATILQSHIAVSWITDNQCEELYLLFVVSWVPAPKSVAYHRTHQLLEVEFRACE